MFARALPSTDHFLFAPNKYLPYSFRLCRLARADRRISMIRLPLGMRFVAKSPNPVPVLFTS